MADDTSFEQKIDLLELVDPCTATRNQLRELARKSGEWSGIPFTLEGGPSLIVEATYPWAAIFGADVATAEAEPDDASMAIRNKFYSHWWRCEVLVFQDRDGKVRSYGANATKRLTVRPQPEGNR